MDIIDKYPFDEATREVVRKGKASRRWRMYVNLRYQLVWQFMLFFCIITIPLMPIAAVIIYIWSAAYVKRYRFQFEKERLVVTRGVIGTRKANIPYDRIQNVVISQSFLERMCGIYSINIETAGAAVRQGALAFGSDASIQGIENPEPIKDFIHWMVKRASEGAVSTDGVTFSSAKTRKDRTELTTLRELQAISATLHSIEAIMRAQNPTIDNKAIEKNKVISVQCPFCAHTFNSTFGKKVKCPNCGTKGSIDY